MRHSTACLGRAGILWVADAAMIAWHGGRTLANPDQAWIAGGSLAVGLLAWMCTARLVDPAPVVGVTAAALAAIICASMATLGTGLGPMVGFVVGMGAGIAARRFRAAGTRLKA